MPAMPNPGLMDLLHKVDECGQMARSLIARGLSPSDIKLAVKRRFHVKISNATATKIIAAVLTVW